MQSKRGFTIIEVMVSLFIFAVALLGLLVAVVNVKKINMRNNIRNLAIETVNNEIEKLRSYGFSNISSSCTGTCDPSNTSCSISVKYRNSDIIFGKRVEISDVTVSMKKVVFTVCWKLYGKDYSYQTETYITRE